MSFDGIIITNAVYYNRRDTSLSKGKWARQSQKTPKIRNETKPEKKHETRRQLKRKKEKKEEEEALTTTLIGNVELAISSWRGDW